MRRFPSELSAFLLSCRSTGSYERITSSWLPGGINSKTFIMLYIINAFFLNKGHLNFRVTQSTHVFCYVLSSKYKPSYSAKNLFWWLDAELKSNYFLITNWSFGLISLVDCGNELHLLRSLNVAQTSDKLAWPKWFCFQSSTGSSPVITENCSLKIHKYFQ